ncbi:hypothetical protein NBRC116493_29010 [Aurantivibrio infirmus]
MMRLLNTTANITPKIGKILISTLAMALWAVDDVLNAPQDSHLYRSEKIFLSRNALFLQLGHSLITLPSLFCFKLI